MTTASKTKEPFEWGPFLKGLAALAIPIAFQNLLTTTGSMVDTIMLGRLGEREVGAVGLCSNFASLMFSCYWGFAGGGVMFISQYWGAKDDKGINRSYGITLSFMMTVSFIYFILATFFPWIPMRLYTDNPEIQAIGIRYLHYAGASYIFSVLSTVMSLLLRSMEKVKVPLIASIASLIANIFLNYVLIFGKLGFPAMGIEGAALATSIAAFVNCAVIAAACLIKKQRYIFEFSQHFKWSGAFIRLYLRRCAPIIANELGIGIGLLLINIVLGRQIEPVIAAVAVFNVLQCVIIAFFGVFSGAASVLVGSKVGAGEPEVAYQRGIRLVYLSSAVVAIACAVIFALHRPILTAMGLSGQSYWYAKYMFLIYSCVAVVRLGNWTHNDMYRSAGDSAYGSILELSFMFGMVVPAVYLSNYLFKAPFLVVFYCMFCDEPIRYILMQVHLYSGKWIKPVSEEGKKALPAFQKAHGIKVKEGKKAVKSN